MRKADATRPAFVCQVGWQVARRLLADLLFVAAAKTAALNAPKVARELQRPIGSAAVALTKATPAAGTLQTGGAKLEPTTTTNQNNNSNNSNNNNNNNNETEHTRTGSGCSNSEGPFDAYF